MHNFYRWNLQTLKKRLESAFTDKRQFVQKLHIPVIVTMKQTGAVIFTQAQTLE